MKFNSKKETLTAALGLTDERTDELIAMVTKVTDKDEWNAYGVLEECLAPLSKKAELVYMAYAIGRIVGNAESRKLLETLGI